MNIKLEGQRKVSLERIGKYCEKIRLLRNISIGQMALVCCCTMSNILHFEKGRNNSALILFEYCRLMTEDELLEMGDLYEN